MTANRLNLVAGLLAALWLANCMHNSRWSFQPEGRMNHPEIAESSGVVASRRHEDVFWTHNDSNNAPRLFAVTEKGRLLRSYPIPQAENNDWEDLALDDRGMLYILDNTSRTDPENRTVIYVLPEPNPFRDRQAQAPRKIEVRFPDGGFDCETIFVWERSIYLVTKPWDGNLPRVYRVDDPQQGETATFLGQIPVYAMITGGDISADGRRIALSSYRALFIFEGDGSPETLLQQEPLVCRLNARQVEGIAWMEDGELVLTNEEREIFRIPRNRWRRHDAPFLKTRRMTIPYLAGPPSVTQSLKSWPEGRWLRMRLGMYSARIARLAWSPAGLHIGVDLPEDLKLRVFPGDSEALGEDWFRPGRLYVMINPDGDRPLAYGVNDRCIVVGRTPTGEPVAQVKFLRPATLVASSQTMPDWIRIQESGSHLLITLTSRTPGLESFQAEKVLGFNLLLIRAQGEVVSWTPLSQRYSWDSPSVWGLLELTH